MRYLTIDGHRLDANEIVRYSPAVGEDAKFKTEIELSTGSIIFVTATPEELDEIYGVQKSTITPKESS